MNNAEKKVILFDDDEDIQIICTYVLEEKGWQVHGFSDCRDIIRRVREIRPQVILMDNWIPDEGGIRATQRLKADPELRNIPVIYFSANSHIAELTRQAGADAYLSKPFDLDDLDGTVSKLAP